MKIIRNRYLLLLLACLIGIASAAYAGEEGTRHITGADMDLYFMNDKVFGTVAGNPLWAIYNCGTDIEGEIDVAGTFYEFQFNYHRGGERLITGRFGEIEMGLGGIRRSAAGFVYEVYFDEQMHPFTIRFEQLEDDHLLNSIIEGELPGGKPVRLTVDGRLCPFATTGIILIAVGAEGLIR